MYGIIFVSETRWGPNQAGRTNHLRTKISQWVQLKCKCWFLNINKHVICYLTHCGLVTPYGDRDLTWTNVDLSSVRSSGIHLIAILQEMPQPSVTEIRLKINYLNFLFKSPRGPWDLLYLPMKWSGNIGMLNVRPGIWGGSSEIILFMAALVRYPPSDGRKLTENDLN